MPMLSAWLPQANNCIDMVDYPAIAEQEIIQEQGYDTNDPQQVNMARAKAGRRKKKSLKVVSALMEHSDGREWLYMLLVATDVFRTSYVFGEPTEGMAFREGKRFVGLQLLADIRKSSPDKYGIMLNECEEKKLPPLFPPNGLE